MSILRMVAGIEMVASTLLVWAFVIMYQFSAPWRGSWAGRLIMSRDLIFGVVLLLALGKMVFDVDDGVLWFAILRVAVFAGVPLVFAVQLFVLYRYQIRRGNDADDSRAERNRGRADFGTDQSA